MPFWNVLPPRIRHRLCEIALALESARDTYFSLVDEFSWDPAPNSLAAFDLDSSEISGDKGWAKDASLRPRALAVQYIRVAADHLYGTGVLCRAGEVHFALYPLVRTAAEHSARAWWVLGPGTTLRQRMARSLLAELVSAELAREAVDRVSGGLAQKLKSLDSTLNGLRKDAFENFQDVQVEGNPRSWALEGERYPGFGKALAKLAKDQNLPIDGGAIYTVQAVLDHPQGFSAREEFLEEDGSVVVRSDPDFIERVVLTALSPFHASLRLLIGYHGWESRAFVEWEKLFEETFPGVFYTGE